ncbi:transcriptional regulator [Halorussus amylolyticus]|uniref:transcriptional regulator n=1 Tax=Halorussus amylolyticus TaxID=1126242 RepID=UPI00192F3FF5|nr:transcriptional regulator [Halorussus amylolyticus]
MAPERDGDSGKFTEQYPREAFLQAVADLENATTAKVAERVSCSYDLAYRRLNALAEDDEIARTQIGSSFVWTR